MDVKDLVFFDIQKFVGNLETALFGEEEPVVLSLEDYKALSLTPEEYARRGITRRKDLELIKENLPQIVHDLTPKDYVDYGEYVDKLPMYRKRLGREITAKGIIGLELCLSQNFSNLRGFFNSFKDFASSVYDQPTTIRFGEIQIEQGALYDALYKTSDHEDDVYEKVSLRLRQSLIRNDGKVIPKGKLKLYKRSFGQDSKLEKPTYIPSFFSEVSPKEFEKVLPYEWLLR